MTDVCVTLRPPCWCPSILPSPTPTSFRLVLPLFSLITKSTVHVMVSYFCENYIGPNTIISFLFVLQVFFCIQESLAGLVPCQWFLHFCDVCPVSDFSRCFSSVLLSFLFDVYSSDYLGIHVSFKNFISKDSQ